MTPTDPPKNRRSRGRSHNNKSQRVVEPEKPAAAPAAPTIVLRRRVFNASEALEPAENKNGSSSNSKNSSRSARRRARARVAAQRARSVEATMREVQAAKDSLERGDDEFVSTWWGKRWIEAIEGVSTAFANRLPRGMDYARGGHIENIQIHPGKVEARVKGRRNEPYEVTIQVKTLTNAQWTRVIEGMGERASCAASLLAGELSEQVIETFAQCGLSLFPTRIREIKTHCTCPDWANPCKHIAAVLYNLGDALDSNPFLLLALRGRTQEQILDALRSARAGLNHDVGPGLDDEDNQRGISVGELDSNQFYRAQSDFSDYRFHITQPEVSAPLLRRLGTPSFWGGPRSLESYLLPFYQGAAKLAEELGLQDIPSASLEPRPRSFEEEASPSGEESLVSSRSGAHPAALSPSEGEEQDEEAGPEERTVLVRRRRPGETRDSSSSNGRRRNKDRSRDRGRPGSHERPPSSVQATPRQEDEPTADNASPRLSRRVAPGNSENTSIENRLETVLPICEGITDGPHTAKQIVWALKKHGAATARQLARRTRLKKTAVMQMIQSLLATGLIQQEGQGERSRYTLNE